MTDETRNITPPATASNERDDQTTEKPRAKPAESKPAQSLRTSEIRYRRLFESACEGILILDAHSRQITDVNPYMVELLEYSREEFLGKELYEIGLLADEAASQKVYRELQESGYVRYEDLPLETKSGKRWDVEFVCNLYDEDGQQVIQCNIRDITARKQAEIAKSLLASIVDSVDVSILSIDFDRTITSWNPGAEALYGYTAAEAIGRPLTMLTLHEDLHQLLNNIERIKQSKTVETFETVRVQKNGEYLHLSITLSPIKDAAGQVIGVSTMARDISERKQAEASLQRKSHELTDFCENAALGLRWIRADGTVLWANQAELDLLGYTREEYIGHNITDFHADAEVIGDILHRLTNKETLNSYEARLRCKDGSVKDVQITSNALFEDGKFVHSRCFTRDITASKRAEVALKAARAEAERANHAKSEFLSRMSHELRTPMNAILGFGQLLEMDDLSAEQREGVRQILKGGRHLLGLINEVLDIARIEAGEMSISLEAVQLSRVVQEAWDLVRPLAARRNVEPLGDWEAACDHTVLADQQRLKQVVINLLSNAIKYNHEGGSVTLTCRHINRLESVDREEQGEDRRDAAGGGRQDDKEQQAADDAPSAPASGDDLVPTLCLEITDTGPGIAPENLDKIFIAFERLGAERSETEGTGIGLALSKRLMELMGGTIGVQSTLGQGSTFWIELPRGESPDLQAPDMAPDSSEDSADGIQHTKRIILYIEDNLSNLHLVESILIRQPHIKLLAAMQGGLGLELAREQRPDLILLDLHLPDIQGNEVLQRLRAEAATRDIPVVMLSADATPRQIERLLQAGANAYLTKPLDVKQFLEVIKQNLN